MPSKTSLLLNGEERYDIQVKKAAASSGPISLIILQYLN